MSTTIDVVNIDTVPSPPGTRQHTRTVEVLNASYQPLRPVTLQRAIRLLAADKAVVEQPDPSGRYVLTSKRARDVAVANRRAPRAHGERRVPARPPPSAAVVRAGRSEWLNTVAACQPCNGRKRDRTPAQAGMTLLVTPFVPRRAG